MQPVAAHYQPRHRSRATSVHSLPLLTAALALCAVAPVGGCRDTRPDASYCADCPALGAETSSATGSSDDTLMPAGDGAASSATADKPPAAPGSAQVTASPAAGKAGAGESAAAMSTMSTMSAMSTMSTMSNGGAGGQRAAATAAPGAGATAAMGQAGDTAGPQRAGSGAQPARDAGTMSAPMKPDAGAQPELPCAMPCPENLPVCEPSLRRCVQCTREDEHACSGQTSVCDPQQNRCVQCTEDNRGCSGATSVCDPKTSRCAVCSNERPGSCPDATPICDETRQQCLECMPGMTQACRGERAQCSPDGRCAACTADQHCGDPAHPRCDMSAYSCVGCEGPNDCGPRFSTAPYCDLQTHGCVECLPEQEAQCGAGRFCEPRTRTCMTAEPLHASCATCSSDADCAVSPSIAACIKGDSGSFCYLAVAPGAACQPGYLAQAVSGRTLQYCLPPPNASCQALTSGVERRMCRDVAECGKGAQCHMQVCTLQCSLDQDCPSPLSCDQNMHLCKSNRGNMP